VAVVVIDSVFSEVSEMITLSWLFIVCCLLSMLAGAFLFFLVVGGQDDGVGCLVIFIAVIWLLFALAQFLAR